MWLAGIRHTCLLGYWVGRWARLTGPCCAAKLCSQHPHHKAGCCPCSMLCPCCRLLCDLGMKSHRMPHHSAVHRCARVGGKWQAHSRHGWTLRVCADYALHRCCVVVPCSSLPTPGLRHARRPTPRAAVQRFLSCKCTRLSSVKLVTMTCEVRFWSRLASKQKHDNNSSCRSMKNGTTTNSHQR